ncbi:MAG: sigma-70 family RNA polymerase sigma factor [Muribaculaceae bacterium]|nr:sigma-70 family RNA polymerase sigma factor [Muribaculaceae bacterium]MDE6682659.1 sigma-70 family RNA polymerase sigma factor [Muribaculaceae bacterium]
MEEKEFRQRVMPLQRLMYALALRLGLPPDDAADAVQETQLKLWRGREGIPEDPPALKAYCMTSIRNECLSVMRRRKETSPIETANAVGAETDIADVEIKDTRRRMEQFIDSLPDGQRRVIRLSSFGEYDIMEISEVTGFTPGNVRQLLSRARKRLREMVSELN